MKTKIYSILLLLATSLHVMGADSYDYQRGDEAYYNGDYEEAIQYYKKDIAANPQHLEAYTSMAAAYRNLGYYGKAANILSAIKSKCVSKDEKVGYYSLLGNIMERAGDTVSAISNYSQALKIDPKSSDLYANRANLYFLQKNYSQAEADYKKMAETSKNSIDSQILLAFYYNNRKQWNEASKYLTKIDTADSSNYAAFAIRGETYYHLKQYDKMAADFTRSEALLNWNDNASQLGSVIQDPAAKQALLPPLKSMMAREKNSSMWPALIGQVYSELDSMLQSTSYYYKSLEIDESSNMKGNIASNLYDLGFNDLALDVVNKGIETDSVHYSFYLTKMAILRGLGRYKEAVAAADALVKGLPDNDLTYYNRGNIKAEAGQLDEALNDLNTALDLDPEWAKYYFRRAKVYQKEGELSKALLDYQKVIDLSPAMGESADTSCIMFSTFQLGRKAEAEKYAEYLIKRNKPIDLYNAACLYSLEGKTDKAVATLRSCFERGYRQFVIVENDPDFANIIKLPQTISLLNEYKEKLEQEEAAYRAANNLPAKEKKATVVKKGSNTKKK